MSKRLLVLLFAGLVLLAGLRGLTPPAQSQAPGANDEPPVRLKKKKPRGDDKPAAEPGKTDEKKKDDKKDEKKSDKKDEPREAEPVTPQEEEKEVLQRVVQNVHKVGERLAKNDLGEATQQTQRDILKDLESLIRRSEDPPPQGGEQQDQQGGAGQDNKDQKQGKAGARSKSSRKSRAAMRQRQRRQRSMADSDKSGGKNGQNGNGGGGGGKDDRARNKNADQYKDIWGHLPQTLRAQMDAYSNPQSFMPKYDDLIKRYYRTIAEQGRRKGE